MGKSQKAFLIIFIMLLCSILLENKYFCKIKRKIDVTQLSRNTIIGENL